MNTKSVQARCSQRSSTRNRIGFFESAHKHTNFKARVRCSANNAAEPITKRSKQVAIHRVQHPFKGLERSERGNEHAPPTLCGLCGSTQEPSAWNFLDQPKIETTNSNTAVRVLLAIRHHDLLRVDLFSVLLYLSLWFHHCVCVVVVCGGGRWWRGERNSQKQERPTGDQPTEGRLIRRPARSCRPGWRPRCPAPGPMSTASGCRAAAA